LALSLAALRGWHGPRTLAAVALAGALVVVANALRTAALFFPAAGLVQVPAWVHPACGVFVFLALTGLLLMLGAFWNRKKPCALP